MCPGGMPGTMPPPPPLQLQSHIADRLAILTQFLESRPLPTSLSLSNFSLWSQSLGYALTILMCIDAGLRIPGFDCESVVGCSKT